MTIIAGCVGDDTPVRPDDSGPAAAHAKPESLETFVAPMWTTTIRDIQFNRFHRHHRVPPAEQLLFVPGLRYDPIDRTFHPRLVQSWELVDDRTVEVNLEAGYRWHDDAGREFGANDLVAQERLGEFITGSRTYDLAEVHADGERAVVYTFAEPVNPRIVAHDYLTEPFWVQRERYADYLKELTATEGDEDARNELRRSLAEYAQPEGIGNGAWQLDEVAENRVTFALVEDNPDAERVGFSEYWLVSNNHLERALLSIGADDQDVVLFPRDTSLEEFDGFAKPDNVTQVERTLFGGRAIAFHHQHEPVDDPRVRRAIAAIVDVDKIAGARELYGLVPATYPWGITGHAQDIPLDIVGELADAFPTTGPDPDRAVELLEAAGCERDDGKWYTASGDRLRIHLVWNRDEVIRQVLQSQLVEFGIAVDAERRVDGVQDSVAIERYTEALEEGAFDVIEINWGTRSPFHAFRQVWGRDSHFRQYDLGWSTEVGEIPEPFEGNEEITVDVEELLNDAYTDGDAARFDEHLRALAWTFAHNVPFLPLFEYSASVLLNDNTISVDGWDPAATLIDHVRDGRIVPGT